MRTSPSSSAARARYANTCNGSGACSGARATSRRSSTSSFPRGRAKRERANGAERTRPTNDAPMLSPEHVRVRRQGGELKLLGLDSELEARAVALAREVSDIAREHVGKARE